MEALSSSVFAARITSDTYPALQSPPLPSSIKSTIKQRSGCLKINENLETRWFSGWGLSAERVGTCGLLRVRALPGEISDEGGDEGTSGNNEFGLIPEEGSSWLEVISID